MMISVTIRQRSEGKTIANAHPRDLRKLKTQE
jgi:hypothetical protein